MSMRKIPDVRIDLIAESFSIWLTLRAREDRSIIERVARITGCSTQTVEKWKQGGQRASFENMAAAVLLVSGPRGFDEVILHPIGLTGCRWRDESDQALACLYVARRELQHAIEEIASGSKHEQTELLCDIIETAAKMLRGEHLGAPESSALIVDLPRRERSA